MSNSNRFSAVTSRVILTAGIAASSVFALALPTLAHAATYAYVNQAGEIRTVVADNPNTALMVAPNIGTHSGVLFLTN